MNRTYLFRLVITTYVCAMIPVLVLRSDSVQQLATGLLGLVISTIVLIGLPIALNVFKDELIAEKDE